MNVGRQTIKLRIKFNFFYYGISLSFILFCLLIYNLIFGSKSLFLTGEMTHGHHQIELACSSCHGDGFSGKAVIQQSCVGCHAEELDAVDDSHPKSKFTDPRNVEFLQKIEARICISCHIEHKLDMTQGLGVTVPSDYCFYCHQDIETDRPSHKGFEYNSCASAGCHNYHDNLVLHEDMLEKYINKEPTDIARKIAYRNNLEYWFAEHKPKINYKKYSPIIYADMESDDKLLVNAWKTSAHGLTEVNCRKCHLENKQEEIEIGYKVCKDCHTQETEGFIQGMHGMRLGVGLSAMKTEMARQAMKKNDKALLCSVCHDPHKLDLKVAAVEACLDCHNDKHSKNYKASEHYALYIDEITGQAAKGTGVSCATCHMPREIHAIEGFKRIRVQHNQNHNLRPNDKMFRTVCINCHGIEFSIDLLADKKVIEENFKNKPTIHIKSVDMVKLRIKPHKK